MARFYNATSGGKETMNISEIIESATKKAFELDGLTPYQINNGLCEEFALGLVSKVAGAEDVCTENFVDFGELPGHMWVIYEDKHYDAECPEGVTDFKELPIFKKYLASCVPKTTKEEKQE